MRYESSPTAATLNALARYAGYAGWREFQQLQASVDPQLSTDVPPGTGAATESRAPESPTGASEPPSSPAPRPRRRWLMTSLIVSTVVILIALISLFAARLRSGVLSQKPEESGKVTFGTKKTSEDLPNSVVFYYDATIIPGSTLPMSGSLKTFPPAILRSPSHCETPAR